MFKTIATTALPSLTGSYTGTTSILDGDYAEELFPFYTLCTLGVSSTSVADVTTQNEKIIINLAASYIESRAESELADALEQIGRKEMKLTFDTDEGAVAKVYQKNKNNRRKDRGI